MTRFIFVSHTVRWKPFIHRFLLIMKRETSKAARFPRGEDLELGRMKYVNAEEESSDEYGRLIKELQERLNEYEFSHDPIENDVFKKRKKKNTKSC